jgi:hypothetical protein
MVKQKADLETMISSLAEQKKKSGIEKENAIKDKGLTLELLESYCTTKERLEEDELLKKIIQIIG